MKDPLKARFKNSQLVYDMVFPPFPPLKDSPPSLGKPEYDYKYANKVHFESWNTGLLDHFTVKSVLNVCALEALNVLLYLLCKLHVGPWLTSKQIPTHMYMIQQLNVKTAFKRQTSM